MGFVLLLGLLAIVIMFVRMTADKIRTGTEIRDSGVETEAVVTRVQTIHDEMKEDDGVFYPYLREVIYLRYRDTDGSNAEGKIVLDGTTKYGRGDRIRIRFVPGKKGAFIVLDPPLRGTYGQSI